MFSGGRGVTADGKDDDTIYAVVINDEEQYSIWPSRRPAPRGWRAAGPEGRKADCLRYIDEVWTDMRPLSLQRLMVEGPRGTDRPEDAGTVPAPPRPPARS